jgi:hypothetical protein
MLAATALLAMALVPRADLRVPSPSPPGMLLRAAHAGRDLWLLDDDGSLRRLPDAASAAAPVATEGKAFDLCLIGGAPVVALQNKDRVSGCSR